MAKWCWGTGAEGSDGGFLHRGGDVAQNPESCSFLYEPGDAKLSVSSCVQKKGEQYLFHSRRCPKVMAPTGRKLVDQHLRRHGTDKPLLMQSLSPAPHPPSPVPRPGGQYVVSRTLPQVCILRKLCPPRAELRVRLKSRGGFVQEASRPLEPRCRKNSCNRLRIPA